MADNADNTVLDVAIANVAAAHKTLNTSLGAAYSAVAQAAALTSIAQSLEAISKALGSRLEPLPARPGRHLDPE